MEFSLENSEYIELNKLLKVFNLVESGGEANACITGGEVFVNTSLEIQKRKKLKAGDVVTFRKQKITITE